MWFGFGKHCGNIAKLVEKIDIFLGSVKYVMPVLSDRFGLYGADAGVRPLEHDIFGKTKHFIRVYLEKQLLDFQLITKKTHL